MIKRLSDGWLLSVYLQPNASRTQIVGLYQQHLKIAISAPPIEGKANLQLVQFLATLFHVAKSAVFLEKGQQSRQKKVKIITHSPLPSEITQWIKPELCEDKKDHDA